jgi:hypothetical protein
VETEEQKSFLESVGCDELQGFLMAYPVAPEKIDALFGQPTKAKAEVAIAEAAPADRRRTRRAGPR